MKEGGQGGWVEIRGERRREGKYGKIQMGRFRSKTYKLTVIEGELKTKLEG